MKSNPIASQLAFYDFKSPYFLFSLYQTENKIVFIPFIIFEQAMNNKKNILYKFLKLQMNQQQQ